MTLLSDDDIFGPPKTPAAAQPTAKAELLSDDDLFGPQEKPGFLDYARELATSTASGLKGFVAQGLRGTAAVPPMPQVPGESEAEFHLRREEFDAQPRVPTTQNPAYRAGESLDKLGESVLGPGPGFEGRTWTRDIGGGLGSVGAVIGLSLLNPAAASLAAVAAGQGEAAQRAVQSGATEEQIRRSAYLASGAGATDLVDALIPHIGGAKAAAGFIRKVGAPIVAAALAEGGQEGLQQFIQNAIAKGVYKPGQDLTEDVPRSAAVGAIVGGGVKGGQIAVGAQPTAQPEPTPEEVALARGALGVAPTTPTDAPKPPMDLDELMRIMGTLPPAPTPAAAPTPVAEVPAAPPGQLSDADIFNDWDKKYPVDGSAPPPDNGLSTPAPVPAGIPPEPDWRAQTPTPAPLEGEILPPEEQVKPEIVEFLARNDKTLEVPTQPMGFSDLLSANAAMTETTRGKTGANTGRLAKLLGPKLYGDPSNMAPVTVKEILQNSFDGIKGIIAKDPKFEGNIDVNLDAIKRTITVTDNGTGMTPEVLGNQFLQIAGTKKESDRSSGGLGIAKMMFLFGNKRMNVITARDGKISTMSTTGEDLFGALEDESLQPTITTRKMTSADLKLFPQGHGTKIEVEVPKSFQDPSTGEQRNIDFYEDTYDHKVVQRSPLFDNINVRFNGNQLPIGNAFPISDFTQFANVNFDWGSARIYVSQEPKEISSYADNLHFLSNGLWQFSNALTKEDSPYGPRIQREFYIDVQSRVKPEDPGYPFDLNRQQFSAGVTKDFAKIFNYMRLVYAQADHDVSVENFGTIQFLNFDEEGKTVRSTGEKKLVPPERTKNAATAIKQGDSVTVKDGKLSVNGREIPELNTEDLDKIKIDVSKLKIPQSEIDPNQIILHDNTLVAATGTPLDAMALSPIDPFAQQPLVDPNADIVDDGMPKIPLSQLAADRFGGRFYEYTYLMGGLFRQLRDVIAGYPVNEPATSTGLANYSGLKEEGIGVSFDPGYRGVSIRVPFSASFLNIAIPIKTDPAGAAVGMIQTMVHELAHHVHRSEKGLAPVMQDLYTQLDLDPNFNFQKFKQRAINVVASYQDVFQFLNGAYTNGLVTTGGKRFKDASDQSAGDGSGPSDLRESTDGAAGGYRLSDWRPLGQSTTGSGGRGAGADSRVESNGAGRDPSFGKNANQRALNSEADPILGHREPGSGPGPDATQQQPELGPTRQAVKSLFGGSTPRPVAAMGAHADRVNWFYKWMAGLTQLTDANPDFVPLVTYTETVRLMHSDEARIQDAALRIGKDWRDLGTQGENLTAFLHDLTRMVYLTPQEAQTNVERQPTAAEFDLLVDKHKLSGPALKVFAKVKGLFDVFIDQVIAVQIEKGIRGMTDPIRMQEKVDQIRNAGLKLKERPYFPFMNFGRHFVQVKNAAGDTVEFYTFERSGFRSAERVQMAALKKIEAEAVRRGNGEIVTHGIIPESADPFIGMPPQLLEAIKSTLNLTQQQLDALDQMRLQSTSSTSFKSRFSNRSAVPGYSMDFKRAFAKYFFHGARYYAKTKYVGSLRDQIKFAGEVGGNKASRIAEYMSDHLENAVLDAKGDFGLFKGAIFLWAMGYVPAAAFQNLSQTPIVTYPFLWAKFGNVSSVSAITKAMANLNSFYKKGTYEGMVSAQSANFEIKALDYGIKSGRISETQAAELAGLSQSEGLIRGIAGNWASSKAVMVQEKAAWMFEMAEQFNRRIAYRAGLYLGQTKPNSKEVGVATKKYAQEFLDLQTRGFTEAEAKAIVTAIHVVDQTQFVYARYARARFMRGRLPGTIFVFKQYMQSTLMMLARNKSDVLPRTLFMWALLGGLAAFPGWEDLKEIFKGVARWRFGKDFDMEKELRKHIMDYTGSEVGADLAIHGFARKGFGIPALLDLMGNLYTGKPGRGFTSNTPGANVAAPVIDMSRQISMGSVLPFEVGKMIGPEKVNSVIGEQTQKASGAVFSVGFNIYKAMWDNRAMSDPKRWEKAIPRALASTSRAFRSYQEGRERTNLGGPNTAATVVNYDVRDTEHLMELIAIAGGFQTERVSSRWDRLMAQVETEKFYEFRRKGLLSQLHEAVKGGDPKEHEDVVGLIQKYNDGLPDYARGYKITGETAVKSLKSRDRELNARESGIPSRKSAIPVQQYLDSLFPSVPVDMRKVR